MRLRLRTLLSAATAAVLGLGAVGLAAQPAVAACTTYYVSSSAGSDANSGCSTSDPWQTLANVNSTTFAAGNQILFQAGGSWTGQLHPLGAGASGNPIVVSSYGTGSAPLIAGAGAASAVYLYDQHDWTVQNLEITNTATTTAQRAGVLVQNDTTGIEHGIHLVGNNIHDISGTWKNGDPQPVTTSAISFDLTDNNKTAGWDDVLIDGNTLTKVDAGAIYLGSPVGLNHNLSSTNVVIQNNTISDAGGNSIVCVFCASPLVQYNVDTDSGYRYSGAALWEGWTSNAVWQYNEVARNWRAQWDGQAFDIDNNNRDTILQYNYTHDNPFGFMEFCCSSTFGALGTSVIRYNISQNDGASNGVFATLQGIQAGASAQFYNNTVYMPPGNNGGVTTGTPATGASATFTNNLIYKLGTGGYSTTNTTWSHNLMFGNHPASEPADPAKITGDPQLVSPGGAGTGLASASAYKVRSGSPAIGAGAVVSGNGGKDYFGNPVSATASPNIGADNGSGAAGATPTAGGYWRFDEGSGSAALDTSGNNNPGVLQAGASRITGQMGAGAVALTGASNSFVDVPSTAIDSSGSYSVAAWVQPNSTSGNQTYVSIDGSSISPFYLQLTGGKYAFTVRSADSTSSTYGQVIGATATVGTWVQLVGEYDSVAHVIKLYVNGVLQGTTAWSSAWKATGHTEIGRAKWNGSPTDFANATLDDVHLLQRTVSDREAYAFGTGATAYYAFDEASGRSFTDSTGNTPNGSLESSSSRAGSGKIGSNALAVDGGRGALAQVPAAAIDTGTSFTVGAWVKLNTVSGGNQTFASMWGGAVSPFYLQLSGGKFTFTYRNSDSTSSGASTVTAGSSASAGAWYHVLGVYDAPAHTIALYVNGTLQGTASFSSAWTLAGSTIIGAADWGLVPVDVTNGQIDDVHFYNRALTASQIGVLATP
ncbi:MAG: LamG domain-containing protein [Leifsonia sp.]